MRDARVTDEGEVDDLEDPDGHLFAEDCPAVVFVPAEMERIRFIDRGMSESVQAEETTSPCIVAKSVDKNHKVSIIDGTYSIIDSNRHIHVTLKIVSKTRIKDE